MAEQRGYCEVAEDRCLNPPGYSLGTSRGKNPDRPRVSTHCEYCGQACCANCRIDLRGRKYACITHTVAEIKGVLL